MAINDVSDAFGDWLEPLIATRRTGGYVDGRWAPNIPVDVPFNGVVQNATPQDLKVLSEGFWSEEAIKIHTTTKLIALVEDTTQGDEIFYDGANWIIYWLADRKIGNYYKAIAIKR